MNGEMDYEGFTSAPSLPKGPRDFLKPFWKFKGGARTLSAVLMSMLIRFSRGWDTVKTPTMIKLFAKSMLISAY